MVMIITGSSNYRHEL